MGKVLLVAVTSAEIQQHVMGDVVLLQKMGYEVEVACNFDIEDSYNKYNSEILKETLSDIGVKFYHVDFSYNKSNVVNNIKVYNKMVSLLRENRYTFMHCHIKDSAFGIRMAAKKTETKCICSVYGFKYYRGSSSLSWALNYPLDKMLARWTNTLITYNSEDYYIAKKYMKSRYIKCIPGTGYDESKTRSKKSRKEVRFSLGVPQNAKVYLTVGELTDRKNHKKVIQAMGKLKNPNIYYVACGEGPTSSYLKKLATKYGVENNVKLIGYKEDIANYYNMADVYVCPSKSEVLNKPIMEAMAWGLPCIVSHIRGNIDLVDVYGGFKINPLDLYQWQSAIENMYNKSKKMIESMSYYNLDKISRFTRKNVDKKMEEIYEIYAEKKEENAAYANYLRRRRLYIKSGKIDKLG